MNKKVLNELNTFKKSSYFVAASFFVVFLFTLFSDSLWVYTWENRDLYKFTHIMYVAFALSSLIVIFYDIKRYQKSHIAVAVSILLGLILCMLVNLHFSSGYAVRACFVIIGLALCATIDFKLFSRYYIRVMGFLATWSLVLYIMALTGSIKSLQIIKNVGGLELYNGVFGFIAVNTNIIPRNWGIFWEPGAYGIYLCFAMILDLFYLKDKNPMYLILFSITIFTTLSTTGLICVGLIFAVYICFAKNKGNLMKKAIIIMLIITGTIIIFTVPAINDIFFGKFETNLDENASFGARLYSILGNLKIGFTDGLIAGTGIKDYEEIYMNTLIGMGYDVDFGNTNTFLTDFARFGWTIFICDLILFYKLSKRISNNKIQCFAIFAIILIMLFMENMSYSFFWLVVPFISFEYKNPMAKYNYKGLVGVK